MGPPWGAFCRTTLTSCFKDGNKPVLAVAVIGQEVISSSFIVTLSLRFQWFLTKAKEQQQSRSVNYFSHLIFVILKIKTVKYPKTFALRVQVGSSHMLWCDYSHFCDYCENVVLSLDWMTRQYIPCFMMLCVLCLSLLCSKTRPCDKSKKIWKISRPELTNQM